MAKNECLGNVEKEESRWRKMKNELQGMHHFLKDSLYLFHKKILLP